MTDFKPIARDEISYKEPLKDTTSFGTILETILQSPDDSRTAEDKRRSCYWARNLIASSSFRRKLYQRIELLNALHQKTADTVLAYQDSSQNQPGNSNADSEVRSSVSLRSGGPLYVSLPVEARLIRVLELPPKLAYNDDEDSFVQSFRLKTVSLNDPPSYHALSYAWGDPAHKSIVQCNGQKLAIPRSLLAALIRLRRAKETLTIWADAICINQQDEEERGHQVAMMKEIFQKADEVHICLDEDDYHQGYVFCAMSIICLIVNKLIVNDSVARFKMLGSYIRDQRPLDYLTQMASQEPAFPREALVRFFDRSWFQRLWVIQEVALAQKAFVHWGSGTILWNWVGMAADWLREHAHVLMGGAEASGIYNACLMHHLRHPVDLAVKPGIVVDRLSFMRLLGLTAHFRSTDPRDKIYGLLGIAPVFGDHPVEIEPDYTISADDLYRDIAVRIISVTKRLTILPMVQHDGEIDPDFPSWVPRWDRKSICHCISPTEHLEGFNAARRMQIISLRPLGQYEVDKYYIELRGIPLAKVNAVSGPLTSEDLALPVVETSVARSNSLINFIQDWSTLATEAAWTITAGKDWYGLRVPEGANPPTKKRRIVTKELLDNKTHLADFKSWAADQAADEFLEYNSSETLSMPKGDSSRFIAAATKACLGRRLFVTKSGHLGLGPLVMQEEDLVCVLFGADVPFVLRPCENGTYRLVGECYVREIMDGKLVDDWRAGEAGTRDFAIW